MVITTYKTIITDKIQYSLNAMIWSFKRFIWITLVEKFLNLTSEISENNFFFNASKKFYCAREVRSHGVWQCTREKCLSKSKGRPKPPISKGTLERLSDFFMPHNKMFYDLVNKDYGWPAS